MKLKLELFVKILTDENCPEGQAMSGPGWEAILKKTPTIKLSRVVAANEVPKEEDEIMELRDSSISCSHADGFTVIDNELVRRIRCESSIDGTIWDDELEMLASSGWAQEPRR